MQFLFMSDIFGTISLYTNLYASYVFASRNRWLVSRLCFTVCSHSSIFRASDIDKCMRG